VSTYLPVRGLLRNRIPEEKEEIISYRIVS
jgi:hypothetical protein